MPQFVQTQNQSVNPALQALQQQAGQRKDTQIEQARLNAGQYMKDFRQDAQNAGYSISEWAKRNENNVKNALFSLSGNNQGVTDSKYQELISGPESFAQKQQRLLDVESANAPNQLFGSDAITQTSTTIVDPSEGKKFTSADIRQKGQGLSNIRDLGASMFNKSLADLTPEEEKKVDAWRFAIADDLGYTGGEGFTKYTGEGNQNKELFNLFMEHGGTAQGVEGSTGIGNFSANQRQLYNTVLQSLSDTAPTGPNRQAVDQMLSTPEFRTQARATGFTTLAKAGNDRTQVDALKESFGSFTKTEFEELFKDSDLTNLIFSEPTPGGTTTTEVIIKEGVDGFVDVKRDTLERVLAEGGDLSQSKLADIELGLQKARSDIATAKTDREKSEALARLYDAQTLQAYTSLDSAGVPGIPKENTDLFKAELKQFNELYPGVATADLDKAKLEDYTAWVDRVTKSAASAGWAIETKPIKQGYGNIFKANLDYDVITGFRKLGATAGQIDPAITLQSILDEFSK